MRVCTLTPSVFEGPGAPKYREGLEKNQWFGSETLRGSQKNKNVLYTLQKAGSSKNCFFLRRFQCLRALKLPSLERASKKTMFQTPATIGFLVFFLRPSQGLGYFCSKTLPFFKTLSVFEDSGAPKYREGLKKQCFRHR